MIKPLKPLNVRIPSDLQRKLLEISREENIPVSDIVRESLQEFVSIRQFRKLRKKILPLAEARGFITDEDVFRLKS